MGRCKNITIIFLLAVGMHGNVAFANSSSTTFQTFANLDMGISGTAKLATKLTTLDGKPILIPEMEAAITEIMKKAGIPGLSCSIINRSKIAYCKTFGLKNNKTGELNDGQTIFVAASFSKTVFAYLVMLLVEDGIIDLNKPVQEFLNKPLPDYKKYADLKGDYRYKQITVRLCLSHSTGFPNWRFLTNDKTLKFLFDPGQRHSYSGEGIQLLQMVVEEITGKGLEELARARVFEPLGMTRTSYVWQDAWKENAASPHDQYERPRHLDKRREADAAGSMFTTAGDYARMLVAIIGAEGKRKSTINEMLRSQIAIGYRNMFGPGAWQRSDENESISLSWCLGWGRFDTKHGRAFFHTGHDFGWQNYTVTYADKGIGVVLMSNSDNFESVARELAKAAIGDTYSPFDWLGYPHYNPNRKKEPPPAPIAIDVDPSILKMYAGTYDFAIIDKMQMVKFEDGQLLLSNDQVQWAPLFAETKTRFFVEDEDYRFVFVKDNNGKVTHMNIEVEGIEIKGEKVK
jgi:CubicO group peptidase (beta-lactamase class C family)